MEWKDLWDVWKGISSKFWEGKGMLMCCQQRRGWSGGLEGGTAVQKYQDGWM